MKILCFILSFLFISCASKKKNIPDIVPNNPTHDIKEQYPEAEIGKLNRASDPFTILDAKIVGNFMELEISYGGGCKLHDFHLIGEELNKNDLPLKRRLQFVQYSKGDECKAIVTEKIKFSIGILAENTNPGNKISLELIHEKFSKTFEYSYE